MWQLQGVIVSVYLYLADLSHFPLSYLVGIMKHRWRRHGSICLNQIGLRWIHCQLLRSQKCFRHFNFLLSRDERQDFILPSFLLSLSVRGTDFLYLVLLQLQVKLLEIFWCYCALQSAYAFWNHGRKIYRLFCQFKTVLYTTVYRFHLCRTMSSVSYNLSLPQKY